MALWLLGGATVAAQGCSVAAAEGAGCVARDAGSVLVGQGLSVQRCSGPCLLLEAGAAAQLEGCVIRDSSRHNGVTAGSGARLRADKCTVSGAQVRRGEWKEGVEPWKAGGV